MTRQSERLRRGNGEVAGQAYAKRAVAQRSVQRVGPGAAVSLRARAGKALWGACANYKVRNYP